MSLITNLAKLKAKIAQAAQKAGRNPNQIKLLVAGKYATTDQLLQLIKASQKLIGENRAQDLLRKYASIGNQAEWHFIGHLQRNKVKDVVPIISMLHSLDSFRLADELEKQLAKIGKTLPVLIEVNLAAEATKSGITPDELPNLIHHCRKLPHLQLIGLMTMSRSAHFATLRHLAHQYDLPELSMGTSADFEIAIQEGATIIRLGRIVFS